jgi:DNA-binding MarR family transcriptional regulator
MHVNPPEDWTPQTPEEGVLHAFMRIGRRMRAKQPGDTMDPSTHFVMYALRCASGPVRLSELAAQAQMDASTVSRHIRSMENAGLVERGTDPDDGRAFRIQLSEAGKTQLDEGMQRRQELLARAMEGWKQSDIKTFEALMTRFADGVNKVADERANRQTYANPLTEETR